MEWLSLNNVALRAGDFRMEIARLAIGKGDYFVLLGPSGSGKSLLLKAIAGLVPLTSGNIILDGKDITLTPVHKRNTGLLFQGSALFPHLTVFRNIAYPLKRGSGATATERKEKVEEMASLTGVKNLLDRMPDSLSGGERQRVALARALILRPKLLMLDEPLASVDSQNREELRSLLTTINRQGVTILHVTHDYTEAMALASHIGVIEQGRIIQTGEACEVIENPSSRFIAHMAGIKNYWIARKTPDGKMTIDGKLSLTVQPDLLYPEAMLWFRPDEVVLSPGRLQSSITNQFQGIIETLTTTPHGIEVVVDAGIRITALVTRQSAEELNLRPGIRVWAGVKASAVKGVQRQR
ncbi:MAG: ATP-binding cassette domain-containing protein [Bacteroidales bacterium]